MEIPVNPESPMGQGMKDTVQAALAPLGYKLTVKFFPSRRGLEELRLGRVDDTVGHSRDVRKILGAPHLARIDFPSVSLHLSRWCRKGLDPEKSKIIVGSRLSSLVAMMIAPHLDSERITLTDIRNQKASVDMMRKNRLDCRLSLAYRPLFDTGLAPYRSLAIQRAICTERSSREGESYAYEIGSALGPDCLCLAGGNSVG